MFRYNKKDSNFGFITIIKRNGQMNKLFKCVFNKYTAFIVQISLGIALLLLIILAKMSYPSYDPYLYLRWVTFGCFAFLFVYYLYPLKEYKLASLFLVLAIFYQPFHKVPNMTKELWVNIDILVLLSLIILSFIAWIHNKNAENKQEPWSSTRQFVTFLIKN